MATKAQLEASESNRRSLEELLNQRDGRIKELEEMNQETEDQLNFARDELSAAEATRSAEAKLATFEAAIEDLESNESKHRASDVIADYDRRMKDLEEELNQKNLLVAKLEDSVSELKFQLDSGLSQSSLNASSLGPLTEVQDRDLELQEMRQQLQSLETALNSTRSRLVSKEEEVDRLSAQVTKLETQQAQSIVRQSAEESGEIDFNSLRSHVISLATALERSENKRAEAISRLISEREGNANSLKRLSESVKRFYSTVSHSDV